MERKNWLTKLTGRDLVKPPESLDEIFIIDGGREAALDVRPEEILEVKWKKIEALLRSALKELQTRGLAKESLQDISRIFEIVNLAAQKLEAGRGELAELLGPFKEQSWQERFRSLAVAIVADTLGTKAGSGAAKIELGKIKAERQDTDLEAIQLKLGELAATLDIQVDVALGNQLQRCDTGYADLHHKFVARLTQIADCDRAIADLTELEYREARGPAPEMKTDEGRRIAADYAKKISAAKQRVPEWRMFYHKLRAQLSNDLPAAEGAINLSGLIFLARERLVAEKEEADAQLKERREHERARLLANDGE